MLKILFNLLAKVENPVIYFAFLLTEIVYEW